MKLSKEVSKMFAEYLRSQSECDTPSYLEPGNLDKSFDTIRRINATTDEIFGQVVGAILKQNNIRV